MLHNTVGYLEVVRPEDDGPALPAEVGSARAVEHGAVRTWQPGWGEREWARHGLWWTARARAVCPACPAHCPAPVPRTCWLLGRGPVRRSGCPAHPAQSHPHPQRPQQTRQLGAARGAQRGDSGAQWPGLHSQVQLTVERSSSSTWARGGWPGGPGRRPLPGPGYMLEWRLWRRAWLTCNPRWPLYCAGCAHCCTGPDWGLLCGTRAPAANSSLI